MGWAKYHADEWVKEGREKGALSGIRYRESPYRERYPKLPPILDEEPWAPRGNVVCRNLCLGGKWDEIEARARPMVTFQDNLVGTDPGIRGRGPRQLRAQARGPRAQVGLRAAPVGEDRGLRRSEPRLLARQAHRAPGECGGTCAVNRGPLRDGAKITSHYGAGILPAGEARTRRISCDLQRVSNEASGQKDQPECEVIFAPSLSPAGSARVCRSSGP